MPRNAGRLVAIGDPPALSTGFPLWCAGRGAGAGRREELMRLPRSSRRPEEVADDGPGDSEGSALNGIGDDEGGQ
jgi:hypothetical protein